MALPEVTTSLYDAANRLTVEYTLLLRTSYTFDAAGNQRAVESPLGDLTTNTWDGENQLVQIEMPSGDLVTFVYSGDFKQIEKETATDVVRYLWDEENVIRETDDANVVEAEYTLQPAAYGNLISQTRAADSAFYHYEAQGSTVQLTDSAEVITDESLYKAFGTPASSSGSTENPYTWLGRVGYRYEDDLSSGESAFYSIRRRPYQSGTGRWLAEDPKGVDEDANLYRYVGNQPTNEVDPSGTDLLVNASFSEAQKVAGYLENELKLSKRPLVLEIPKTPYYFILLWAVDDGPGEKRLKQQRHTLSDFWYDVYSSAFTSDEHLVLTDNVSSWHLQWTTLYSLDDAVAPEMGYYIRSGYGGYSPRSRALIDASYRRQYETPSFREASAEVYGTLFQVFALALSGLASSRIPPVRCAGRVFAGIANATDEFVKAVANALSRSPLEVLANMEKALNTFITSLVQFDIDTLLRDAFPKLYALYFTPGDICYQLGDAIYDLAKMSLILGGVLGTVGAFTSGSAGSLLRAFAMHKKKLPPPSLWGMSVSRRPGMRRRIPRPRQSHPRRGILDFGFGERRKTPPPPDPKRRQKKRRKKRPRPLSELVPNGKIPWGDDGADFVKWFDDLSAEELRTVLKKYDLSGFIRHPKGKHEWLKVEQLQKFKEWNVSMSEIWRFRTDTTKLVGTIPGTHRKFAHTVFNERTGRLQTGPGAKQFDNELAELTRRSTSLADFNGRLQRFVRRWKIDPGLLPKPYPRASGG